MDSRDQGRSGDSPNAKTVAAMKAGDRGEVSSLATIDELMADLHAGG